MLNIASLKMGGLQLSVTLELDLRSGEKMSVSEFAGESPTSQTSVGVCPSAAAVRRDTKWRETALRESSSTSARSAVVQL